MISLYFCHLTVLTVPHWLQLLAGEKKYGGPGGPKLGRERRRKKGRKTLKSHLTHACPQRLQMKTHTPRCDVSPEWAGPARDFSARPGPESPDRGRPGRAAFLVVITWESEEGFPFFL